MLKIKLPNFNKFKGTKCFDPYTQFFLWAYSQTLKPLQKILHNLELPLNKELDVTAVSLNDKDQKRLKELSIKWLMNINKISRRKATADNAWHDLCYGPKETDEEPGYAYIEENKILISKE